MTPAAEPTCGFKASYASRLAADNALAIARAQWRHDPRRAPQPPTRVYLCDRCSRWHLTHKTAWGEESA